MIQCVLSPTLSLHFAFPSFMPFSPHSLSFSTSLCTRTLVHTRTQSTQPWKTQSAVWARSLANELSYWNRKESALCCRKCCYGKPYRRGTEGKLLVRTKKHENVLSLQMYQFTFRRSRLHPFLQYFISFIPLFLPTTISHLIIIHKTPLSAVRETEKKNSNSKKWFFSLIQVSILSS